MRMPERGRILSGSNPAGIAEWSALVLAVHSLVS